METSFVQVVKLCVRHTYIQNINLLEFANLEHVYVCKVRIFLRYTDTKFSYFPS
jgi:hypothetical protein